ncbi:Threonine efflux protein (plasmid) [Sulfitobacter sp. DSM 110093]|uniref:LysE family translocator n=1 Tax=Sulfitobacter sp. DSM 110093 TaxID=2883127 RepID=UPI001FAB9676|nr:LysE family translocator [Sulfitobacter sp. DSM 110093]UOA34186.1 Threonine efflux protein [Sulfitobacter sp. DSM 110093]
MELSHLIAFNIALIASILSPGPAFLVALKTTLSSGRQAGVAVGLGLGLVASFWTLAALMGLEAVFLAFPWAYAIVKMVGAVYLLYVAYSMWRGAREPITTTVKPARHAFRQGMMINILNPKSVLFAAAVLVVIFPEGMRLTENLLIVGNHLIIEVMFYTALAFGMSRPAVSKSYLHTKIYFDRAASAVLGLLGLRLLFSR